MMGRMAVSTKTKRIICILCILIVIVGILVGMDKYGKADITNAIDSFEDCAAAGYPIMDSYPEQCAVPGGPSFTKQY